MKKPLNTEKGASLVLVVFMMVVLVSFGILALTSAAANMRLSHKTLSWREDYYALDSQASDIVYGMDSLLHEAEMEARALLTSGSGMQEIFASEYMRLAREKLEDYSAENAQLSLRDVTGNDSLFLMEINLESELKSDIGQKYLTAQLAISPPEYLFPTERLEDAQRAANTQRYSVVMWMQWQEDFDYEYGNTIDLWNGLLNGEEVVEDEREPVEDEEEIIIID